MSTSFLLSGPCSTQDPEMQFFADSKQSSSPTNHQLILPRIPGIISPSINVSPSGYVSVQRRVLFPRSWETGVGLPNQE